MTHGQNAISPDNVVHRMNHWAVGGVICGAMPMVRGKEEQSEYWLFWSRKPVTCLACIAKLEQGS